MSLSCRSDSRGEAKAELHPGWTGGCCRHSQRGQKKGHQDARGDLLTPVQSSCAPAELSGVLKDQGTAGRASSGIISPDHLGFSQEQSWVVQWQPSRALGMGRAQGSWQVLSQDRGVGMRAEEQEGDLGLAQGSAFQRMCQSEGDLPGHHRG